jgi:hypothetical protein
MVHLLDSYFLCHICHMLMKCQFRSFNLFQPPFSVLVRCFHLHLLLGVLCYRTLGALEEARRLEPGRVQLLESFRTSFPNVHGAFHQIDLYEV